MHLIPGRLPHGLPVLCVDSGRTYEKLTSFRDAGSDLPDPEIHGRATFNVVVMGSGEPMDNYDNLVRFIRLLSDENGLNISQRNITVSTCGIVPKILKLADEGLSITWHFLFMRRTMRRERP